MRKLSYLFALLRLNWFEFSNPREDIEAFIAQELRDLREPGSGIALPANPTADPDRAIRALSARLPRYADVARDAPDASRTRVESWRAQIPSNSAMYQGSVARDSGVYLDMMDELGMEVHRTFLVNSMERLLRHAEIRRARAFLAFHPAVSTRERWLQRFDLIILFARYARRHNDLRALNAAFKLTDSMLPVHRFTDDPERRTHFLLALAEQEKSAKELLAE